MLVLLPALLLLLSALERVLAVFRQQWPDVPVWAQERRMDENARQDRTASGEQMNQTENREQMAATDDGDVDRELVAALVVVGRAARRGLVFVAAVATRRPFRALGQSSGGG